MASEMTEGNRRIVERFIAEGVLEGRLDVFNELCDPGVINHAAAPQASEGIDALKRVIGFRISGGPTRSWLPTWSFKPYARAPGSVGSFRGFATPQGVTTAVEMVHIWRLANGNIVEHWAVRDDLALMRQLGVVKSG